MSLLLDLSRLPAGRTTVDRHEAPDAFESASDDFRFVAPVDLALEASRDGQKVRLTGRLRTRLGLGCSRCLDPFELDVDSPVDALYLPGPTPGTDDEREIADDDLGVSYYEDDEIDLAELVREQCYLALPMKPLCREDCRGLCPVCGINKNRETCTCDTNWVDPRLEGLKQFKQQ